MNDFIMERISELDAKIIDLEKKLSDRDDALDAIAYLCADFDANCSMADSMLENDEYGARSRAYHHGQEQAAVQILKVISDSGYIVRNARKKTSDTSRSRA